MSTPVTKYVLAFAVPPTIKARHDEVTAELEHSLGIRPPPLPPNLTCMPVLTLDRSRADKIEQIIAGRALKAFSVRLGLLRFFGADDRRVIYRSVESIDGALDDLNKYLSDEFRSIDIPEPSPRPEWYPRLTLAVNLSSEAYPCAWEIAENRPFPHEPFVVDTVVFYQRSDREWVPLFSHTLRH